MKAYALTKKDSHGLEALELIEAPVPRPQIDKPTVTKLYLSPYLRA